MKKVSDFCPRAGNVQHRLRLLIQKTERPETSKDKSKKPGTAAKLLLQANEGQLGYG